MNKLQVLKLLEYCGMSYNDIQARNKNEKVIFINESVRHLIRCISSNNRGKASASRRKL